MTHSLRFGHRSTADQVLAGVDLSGKRFLVTGCNSGLGFETMNALAANGGSVIGLARTLDAASQACAGASPNCIPIACDLTSFDSIAAARTAIRGLSFPLDAIVANAGVANVSSPQVRYGVERNFLVNYLGHFLLIDGLTERLRDRSGRVVIVSGALNAAQAPVEGIMFDNLDGRRSYDARTFYAQSKLASALYAKELSRRLKSRGIAVNSVDPGSAHTRLNRGIMARLFAKAPARAAATQTLLAASPQVDGLTGGHWADCNIFKGNSILEDAVLAKRLWDISLEILQRQSTPGNRSMQQAA
jgi:WW domain-containing oxidoreductase